MLNVTIASGTQDLQQILKLQKKNLIRNLSKEEIQSQGFVTVDHSLEVLEKMNQLAPSVIIKDQEQVVAYALTMLCESKDLVPELESMFERLASLQWKNKQLNAYSYYVMGQICIDKDYRGQGLFDQLYQKHREVYQSRFHFIVTEVATRNLRSLKAHLRVGFETINTYTDELDEWAVVVWDWKPPNR
jgi:ribosomal protein S18 acetylase RimI-like enzyme